MTLKAPTDFREDAAQNSSKSAKSAASRRWNIVLPDGEKRSLRSDTNAGESASRRALAACAAPIMLAILPLFILASLSALLSYNDADRYVARMFCGSGAHLWPSAKAQPWTQLYDLGCWPGLLLGATSFFVAVAGLATRRLRVIRFAALYIALVFALGPGIVINGIFKPHWGRPRPRQTAEFGGQLSYCQFWQATGDTGCRSFPSGHASMGFFLMAPAFVLIKKNRKAAIAFLVVGLAAGGAVGAARIVQGGHFLTDVLWSAGFVYLVCVLLYPFYRWCLSVEDRWIESLDHRREAIPLPVSQEASPSRRRAA